MRVLIILLSLISAVCGTAQLEVNQKIDFSSAPVGSATVSGLGTPTDAADLSSLGNASSGFTHWCNTGGLNNDTLSLTRVFAAPAIANGTLLRFQLDSTHIAGLYVAVDNEAAAPILALEGYPLTNDRVEPNALLEIQWKDSAYFLMNAPPNHCPTGYLKVSDALCIQQSDNSLAHWFEANDICEKQGASLCSFAEYVHACRKFGNSMTGLFNNWEWIDDTSDHTHTADQVGRWNCHSNRSRGATYQDLSNFRCCYLLR